MTQKPTPRTAVNKRNRFYQLELSSLVIDSKTTELKLKNIKAKIISDQSIPKHQIEAIEIAIKAAEKANNKIIIARNFVY